MSKLQAIFFDHDGTLVDTEPLWAQAKTQVTADFGGSWTEADTLATLGRPARETLERMQALGVDLPKAQVYELLKKAMGQLMAAQPVTFLPGVLPLLEEVAAAGLPAAIVTNGTWEVASRTAAQAPEGLFKALVTDEQVSQAKPDPEPYLLAAQKLGVDPAFCVALEDSPSGAQSAQAAGMKVLVLPGISPVPAELGHAHYSHKELTLDRIRALVEG